MATVSMADMGIWKPLVQVAADTKTIVQPKVLAPAGAHIWSSLKPVHLANLGSFGRLVNSLA